FVQFLGWFEDPNHVYLVMEYFEHGDLKAYINSRLRICQESAKSIIKQILEGLNIMVELNFVHRDLKPQNIFIFKESPLWLKIGDFGLTKRLVDNTVLRTQAYTKNYAAPEVRGCHQLNEDDSDVKLEYTNAVDIWSLGIITHEVLTKEVPFESETRLVRYVDRSMGFPMKALEKAGVGSSTTNFIKRLLAPMPQDRPTAEEALLDHWLSETILANYVGDTAGATYYPEWNDN
ncbi:kinase-like protein, partial [Wilcoxina mikolae CBS 423.85]